MTKIIKKKQLNKVIMSIVEITSGKSKNIISLRCEKIGGIINEISTKLNSELSTLNEEYASCDKDMNLLREEVITTDKTGNSKKENSGIFKYTFKKTQERKKAIEDFWNQDIEVPSNVVSREKHPDLYKKIIQDNSFTTLSNLAGIILDIPVGEDGFVDEEWVLGFLESGNKALSNGQEKAAEAHA